jgi:hypothetical protein
LGTDFVFVSLSFQERSGTDAIETAQR